MKTNFTLIVFLVLGFNQANGQDFKNCRLDFTAIEPSKKIDWNDVKNEFKVVPEHLPNYDDISDNSNVITWYQYARELTKKELTKYTTDLKEFRKQIIISQGGVFDNNPEKWPWKINDTTFIRANKVYIKKSRAVNKSLPLFYTHDLITELDPYSKTISPEQSELIKLENEVYERYDYASRSNITPIFKSIGTIPIFDLKPYQDFIWKLEDEKTSKFTLTIEGKSIVFFGGMNTTGISKFLWRITQLEQIEKLINDLNSRQFVIYQKNIQTILNPQISKISYDFKQYILKIEIVSNNSDQLIEINGQEIKVSSNSFLISEAPIYDLICYNKTLEEFNNLKLPADQISNSQLKLELKSTIEKSSDWNEFKIEKVILTNQSQWSIVTNKYSGLKESRFMLADIYVKNIGTGECFLHNEVYFSQKADPIQGFIYEVFVAVPHNFIQYPCNLK